MSAQRFDERPVLVALDICFDGRDEKGHARVSFGMLMNGAAQAETLAYFNFDTGESGLNAAFAGATAALRSAFAEMAENFTIEQVEHVGGGRYHARCLCRNVRGRMGNGEFRLPIDVEASDMAEAVDRIAVRARHVLAVMQDADIHESSLQRKIGVR